MDIYIYGYQVPDTRSCQVPDRACWYQDYAGKKIGNPQIPFQIQPFSIILPAKRMPSRRAVN